MATTKVISKVMLFVPLNLNNVPEHMSEQWARTQKNIMDITEKKRAKVIPHEAAYLEKMAGVSAAKYAQFISSTFISRKGKDRDAIVNAQSQNINQGYKKYKAALDYLTAEVDGEFAKRMKERIDIKKDIYSQRMAQTALPFTGEKTIGKSVCGIAPHWLVGDMKIVGHLAGAEVKGPPVNVARDDVDADLRSDLKAALSNRLLKSGVIIVNAKFAPAVMRKENNAINAVIRGLQNPRYAPFAVAGDSHCDYILSEGKMYLEIQVSQIVP